MLNPDRKLIKETVNKILGWLLYVALFYYILLLIGGGIGFMIQGIELNIFTEVIILIVAIVLSVFLTIQINNKINVILIRLSFLTRLFLTIFILLSVVATLHLVINALPDRI